MHYYKRNIGDYHKKAGRLSILQHGTYTLLLDACYDREEFPTREQAIEWVWASSQDEIDAVDFVLSRFFDLVDKAYVQNRIQDELDSFHEKSEKNRQIALEREEKRRKRKQGVHETCSNEHEAPPNHKPLTTNHKPIKESSQDKPDYTRILVDQVMDMYNTVKSTEQPNWTAVESRTKSRLSTTKNRIAYVQKRIESKDPRETLEWFTSFLVELSKHQFYSGRPKYSGDNGYKWNFDSLFREKNFVAAVEALNDE